MDDLRGHAKNPRNCCPTCQTRETEGGGGGAYQCKVVGDELSLASPISDEGRTGWRCGRRSCAEVGKGGGRGEKKLLDPLLNLFAEPPPPLASLQRRAAAAATLRIVGEKGESLRDERLVPSRGFVPWDKGRGLIPPRKDRD